MRMVAAPSSADSAPSLLSLPRDVLEHATGPSEWVALGMSCRSLRLLLEKGQLTSAKREALACHCDDLWLSARALHLFHRRTGRSAGNAGDVVEAAMSDGTVLAALCRLSRMARAERDSRRALLLDPLGETELPRQRHESTAPLLTAVLQPPRPEEEDGDPDDLR